MKKNISPKIVSLIVLIVNIIFMLITALNLPSDKIIEYMASATARIMFFISIAMGIASLVYTIKGRRNGLVSSLTLAIVNVILSLLIVLLPAISFTAYIY